MTETRTEGANEMTAEIYAAETLNAELAKIPGTWAKMVRADDNAGTYEHMGAAEIEDWDLVGDAYDADTHGVEARALTGWGVWHTAVHILDASGSTVACYFVSDAAPKTYTAESAEVGADTPDNVPSWDTLEQAQAEAGDYYSDAIIVEWEGETNTGRTWALSDAGEWVAA